MRPTQSKQLVPAAGTALLLIDVINDLDFPGSDALVEQAPDMARRLEALKKRAAAAGVPCIYVNDNFGQWQSDFRQTVAHCTRRSAPGRQLSARLKPTRHDYFVLKPKHSGFYDTTLETLLDELKIRRVILSGIAGNICVLFTASDAYMRGLQLVAAEDCIISNTAEENAYAVRLLSEVMKARVLRSADIAFRRSLKR
jgi:nicotinamidase-related amidase